MNTKLSPSRTAAGKLFRTTGPATVQFPEDKNVCIQYAREAYKTIVL